MTSLLSRFRAAHPNIEVLSASLDGREAGANADAHRRHISACATCTKTLAELGATRSALRAVPAVDAPRSFRLRQADVEARGVGAPPGSAALRFMPAMSALAVVLFAALVAADLLSNGGSSSSSGRTDAQAVAATSAGQMKANAENTPAAAPTIAADMQRSSGAAPSPPTANAVQPNLPAVVQDAPAAPPTAAEAADGTLSAAAASSTAAAPPAAVAEAPTGAPTDGAYRDAHMVNNGNKDGTSIGLRIAEAALAAIALGTAGIAGVGWLRSRKGRT